MLGVDNPEELTEEPTLSNLNESDLDETDYPSLSEYKLDQLWIAERNALLTLGGMLILQLGILVTWPESTFQEKTLVDTVLLLDAILMINVWHTSSMRKAYERSLIAKQPLKKYPDPSEEV